MFLGSGNAQGAQDTATASAQDGAVFEAGAQDFEERVLKASMEKPVIAYFTAPWCGPCKQLGPVLEAAVNAVGGKVSMAKINIDDNQELAAALRIQSVPTIFGFFQGRPVDAFQGAVPESQIKAFIDKLLEAARQGQPDALDIPEALKMAATALAEGELKAAHVIYADILQQDEKNAQAYVGLVRVFIAADQLEQASELVENAPEDIAKESTFGEAKTALELAKNKPDESTLLKLGADVQNNPDDHQKRLELGQAQFSAGQKEDAIETLIEIIRRDREWNDEAARKELLKFFEALGYADPLAVQGRKKLSSLLFS